MGLALVETDLDAALHVSIKQPIDDEKRTFDATDFTQGKCKLMLAWIGCKLLEQLTGRHQTPPSSTGLGAMLLMSAPR